ncbi:PAS domain-containing protein [Corallococcus sp. M34]|uniref:PAS domain-containing sensor histidine kinase n=1 Tax=Citreicoccus inhibens TaxID=2849499 RepID=UPI001C22D995|nr:PAS domain-containing protein [Citreicoccus inhibens]MBU8894705.1 PAS domain-containing protein [Citreicoccus inhibens]
MVSRPPPGLVRPTVAPPASSQEDILRYISESSDDLIAALDTGFRFVAFNPAYARTFEQLFGVAIAVGMDLRAAIQQPVERANAEAAWARALQGEAYTLVSDFGELSRLRRTYEIVFRPLFDAAGTRQGAFHIARDVTEREQAQAEVRQLTAKLERRVRERTSRWRSTSRALARERSLMLQTMDRVTDAFFAVDRDWRLTYINRHAERLMRRSRESLLGRVLWTEFPELVGGAFERSYRRALAEQRTLVFEEFHPTLDSWFEVRAYPSEEGLSVFFRDIGERKSAELRLRDSERFMRSVLGALSSDHEDARVRRAATEAQRLLAREEAARKDAEATREAMVAALERIEDGFVACDLSWRFTYVNQHAEAHIGRPRGSLLGRYVWEAFPGAVGSPLDHLLRRAAQTQRVQEEEVPSSISDRWLRVVVHPSPEGLSFYFRDVTARRVAQQALGRSEAKLSGIIAMALDAIIVVDASQRIQLFNDGARRIFGYAPEEVLGQPLEVLIPEASRERHREFVQRFSEQPRAPSRSMGERAGILGLRKSGEVFPAEASISRLDLDDGRVMVAMLRDVTARRNAERRQHFLAEAGAAITRTLDWEDTARAIARLAVPLLADGCAVVARDTEGKVEPCTQVSAMSPLLSALLRAAVARPPRGALGGVVEQALATGEAVGWDAPSGDVSGVASAIAAPLVAHQRTVGLLLAAAGPGRRYDADDLALAREFARRAALAMENARLYRASREAISVRDEMLGIVSHDLRSPLGAITLLCRATARHLPPGEPGARGREGLEKIRRVTVGMNRLIEDLLEVARLESGHSPLDAERLEVPSLVAQVVELNEPLATSQGLTLRVSLEGEAAEVWADRGRVLRVFQNLLDNAIKFTPRGGSLLLRAEPWGDFVRFSVADTGAGIEPAALPHVFDRFWQARHARKAGAGLGLAIVKSVVEAHGGLVQVESPPGQGATFAFTLPLAGPQPPAQASV